MPEKRKLLAVRKLRALMDGGMLRKVAIATIRKETGACRATIYNWCRKFKISTR